MAAGTAATSSSSEGAWMPRSLLEAATRGDAKSIIDDAVPVALLLAATPHRNTCLHIAASHGHREFCEEVVQRKASLLAAVNADEETPLLKAVAGNHVSLASFLLKRCREHEVNEAILQEDKHACNALHHAIRSGHRELALELIAAAPALSRAVNEDKESPMFIAVTRDFTDVFEKLLEIPDSADGGTYGTNALHAAVRRNNTVIAKKIIEKRPGLAREGEKEAKYTPVQLAVHWNRAEVLELLLEHDCSLGYGVSMTYGDPLLVSAAFQGHVDVAKKLLEHCPDAPCAKANGTTCLHKAVQFDQPDFVEFVCRSQLRRLVNMRTTKEGKTALHYAVERCNPRVVAALLSHEDIDLTMFDREFKSALWKLFDASDDAKTLNWTEIVVQMLEADPKEPTSIINVQKATKKKLTSATRKDVKKLTETYTSNTSLVATLIATITFAAAFTLPGGYSSDTGTAGLPIMASNFAFQAFLISDTLAMCSSIIVAFICILARLEDFEFLLYYISITKKLMWFAYMATVTAFATGLYTVLAPRLPWLAIAICLLPVILPVLTKVLGEWSSLKLRVRFLKLRIQFGLTSKSAKPVNLDVMV